MTLPPYKSLADTAPVRVGFTASELGLMSFPPIKYVVPGYIPEGLTILAGKPKLGKSWLCLDIAIAVAAGRYTLGNILCIQGDVLYLALEDNQRRLHSRVCKVLGENTNEWPSRLTFSCDWSSLDKGGVEAIKDWIASVDAPRLIIVDTLAKVRGSRDERDSSYDADYRALRDLHSIAGELGVAIVLVHHVRKMDADDPLDTVSGTTGLTGAADTILVLSRDAGGVTLYGRGRDIEEIETAVRFSSETCRWTAQGEASKIHRTNERGAILRVLEEASEPLSPRDIADLSGHGYDAVRQLLIRMWQGGEIDKPRRGLYSCKLKAHNSSHSVTNNKNTRENQLDTRSSIVTLPQNENVTSVTESQSNVTVVTPHQSDCHKSLPQEIAESCGFPESL